MHFVESKVNADCFVAFLIIYIFEYQRIVVDMGYYILKVYEENRSL